MMYIPLLLGSSPTKPPHKYVESILGLPSSSQRLKSLLTELCRNRKPCGCHFPKVSESVSRSPNRSNKRHTNSFLTIITFSFILLVRHDQTFPNCENRNRNRDHKESQTVNNMNPECIAALLFYKYYLQYMSLLSNIHF